MDNSELSLPRRVEKLEAEIKWRTDQIAVLLDHLSSLLSKNQQAKLREDIDFVYDKAIKSINNSSQTHSPL